MATDSGNKIPPAIWWILSIPALLLLVWCSGLLYWRIGIRRAISDPRRDSSSKTTAGEPPSKLLHEAGSRAFPLLLEAMKDSVRGPDRDLANLLYLVYCDTSLGAESEEAPGPNWDRMMVRVPKTSSLEHLRLVAEGEEARWEERKEYYPPWWMWWGGKRLLK